MIEMKYGYKFDEDVLVKYIKASGRDYIIQGQKAVPLASHSKPQSLTFGYASLFLKNATRNWLTTTYWMPWSALENLYSSSN